MTTFTSSTPTVDKALHYASDLPADCWADRCILVLAAEVVRLRSANTPPFARFEHVLRKHGLVDSCAFDDPEGFDNYRTHGAAHAAYRDLLSPKSKAQQRDL